MQKPISKPSKTKHNKFKKKLFNLGNPKELTKEQLSKLAQGFSVKYALSLEETILEQHKDKINLKRTIEFQQDHIDKLKKTMEEMVDHYEDTLETQEKELLECHKGKNDITRAYNGLHSLGKFAEEQGIDIKKASRRLPENSKYNFKQKDTLLESGKVKHEFFLRKKKNGKGTV